MNFDPSKNPNQSVIVYGDLDFSMREAHGLASVLNSRHTL